MRHVFGFTFARRGAPLSALACLVLSGGCAVGPDYARPAESLPQAYTAKPWVATVGVAGTRVGEAQELVSGLDIPAQWWQLFHSQPLNDLVAESLKNNPNVASAQAALRGALLGVKAQQGAYFPSVDASLTSTRQMVANTLASPAASAAPYYNLHTAQVTVSYTPDVFGSNQRQVESLLAQAESQRFQLEATYLTLTSNVVNAAIQEAALRGQLRATQEVIALQRKALTMFQRQYQLGQVSTADLAVQETALALSEATLPPLQKQLAQQRNALNALAGRFANQELDASFDLDGLQLPVNLPLTVPSTLVEHRPDVRAAEEQLHAASAQIGVAVANRLPNFTLGVNAWGSAAYSLMDLFKAGTAFWNLAAGVAQPVFHGGTLKARQDMAQAAYEQAAAQYRSTVITAFQNVADALQALKFDADALNASSKAERAADRSLSIARRQLALGDISPLTLLTTEQAYQQAKLALVQAQANRLADTVALFQALGGGWWNRSGTVPTESAAKTSD